MMHAICVSNIDNLYKLRIWGEEEGGSRINREELTPVIEF